MMTLSRPPSTSCLVSRSSRPQCGGVPEIIGGGTAGRGIRRIQCGDYEGSPVSARARYAASVEPLRARLGRRREEGESQMWMSKGTCTVVAEDADRSAAGPH